MISGMIGWIRKRNAQIPEVSMRFIETSGLFPEDHN